LVAPVPLPFGGFYSASKCALEGYTEALRYEVKPFNIRISLVEPGFIKARLAENTQYPAQQIPDYDPWRQRVQEARREREGRAREATVVAECVLSVLESSAPRLRYMEGREARIARLRRVLPASLFERLIRRASHLDAKK
jgi:NAD(P)-dependent dehydrogenase (short-subunit alcohol dehydrogenase family)